MEPGSHSCSGRTTRMREPSDETGVNNFKGSQTSDCGYSITMVTRILRVSWSVML